MLLRSTFLKITTTYNLIYMKTNHYHSKKYTIFICCFYLLLFILPFSCKKDFYNTETQNQSSPGMNSFSAELRQELITYNKTHPIMDSIAQLGSVNWSKMVTRVSIGSAMPLNFSFPISRGNDVCNQAVEFSLSKDKKLVKVAIRRYDDNMLKATSTQSSQYKSEIERTETILYHLAKQSVNISPALMRMQQKRLQLYNEQNTKSRAAVAALKTNTQIPVNAGSKSAATSDAALKSYTMVSANAAPTGLKLSSMQADDQTSCQVDMNFDFYFVFTGDPTDAGSGLNQFEPDWQSQVSLIFSALFLQDLSATGISYEDETGVGISSSSGNVIVFNSDQDVQYLGNVIENCMQNAIGQTAMQFQLTYANLQSYSYTGVSTCGGGVITGGGSGGDGSGWGSHSVNMSNVPTWGPDMTQQYDGSCSFMNMEIVGDIVGASNITEDGLIASYASETGEAPTTVQENGITVNFSSGTGFDYSNINSFINQSFNSTSITSDQINTSINNGFPVLGWEVVGATIINGQAVLLGHEVTIYSYSTSSGTTTYNYIDTTNGSSQSTTNGDQFGDLLSISKK